METKTSKIRSWLYGAETRISLEQLTLDFGEFPPAPLQVVTSPNSKFKILHITNTPRKALYVLSNIKYVISLLPEFFKSAEFIQHKSTIKPQITQIVIAHRETVTELFSSFRKEIGICKTENKRLKLLLLYLLRVTVTGLLLFFLVYIYRSWQYSSRQY